MSWLLNIGFVLFKPISIGFETIIHDCKMRYNHIHDRFNLSFLFPIIYFSTEQCLNIINNVTIYFFV